MKRNSTTLFLQSPGATTQVPWINNTPDFSAFTEPTLSVLQKAWNDFLDSGEELEVIPDPEPFVPLPEPNPAQFLQQMFQSSTFEAWLNNFSNFKQAGFLDAATNAKVDGNWVAVQTLYDQFKLAISPSNEAIAEWQSISDSNGISLTF